MATLHVICGKAGAGKTTLARSLAQSLPAVMFGEDEWIDTLGLGADSPAEFSMARFGQAIAKCRAVIGPLAGQILRLGVSVVFDFAGNTVKSRQWARDVAETAGADLLLHVIAATDAECLAAIHRRNAEKPPGLYWGDVSDEIFHAVTAYFVPPRPEEGFRIRLHNRA